MVYGNRISITEEQLYNNNAGMDIIGYTKKELAYGIGVNISNNLNGAITEEDSPERGIKTFELRIVAYSMSEFSEKIKSLKNKISHLKPKEQTEILNIFNGEDDNRYKKDDGKVYI